MATAPGDEAEYESDPDDSPLPSMRRRDASDESESDGGGLPARRRERRHGIGYEADLDGQGAAATYDEEEEFDEEEDEENVEAEEEEELVVEERVLLRRGDSVPGGESPRVQETGSVEPVGYEGKDQVEEEEAGEVGEVVKKENEPYAVPTAGAFYMHDDRFQENGRGRQRRMPGWRKLWESKDDRAWMHDRFEEMNLQDARYDEGRRMPNGRFRGRGGGRARGTSRGFGRGNTTRAYYGNDNNQNRVPKSVRGRGPRRYVPAQKSTSEAPTTQQKQTTKQKEPTSNHTVGGQLREPNVQSDPALPKKHVFASSLSSASPPFYPSGTSSQEISAIHKRGTQAGCTNKASLSSLQMGDKFKEIQSGSFLKGKTIYDSIGHDRLYMSASLPQIVGKPLVNPTLQSPGSSLSSPSTTQSSYSGIHGKGLSTNGPPNYQQTPLLNQVARVPPQSYPPVLQQRPSQALLPPALRASPQQLGHRPASDNQSSAPSQLPSTNSFEVVERDSISGTNKSKTALIEKGKTNNQGSEKGTFLYNGAQVIGAAGAMSLPHGDPNFPGTPALLPVMQFTGQHPGGLGVPAVGMALPGYVAQSQLGFGNSEMTWMPVLTGAAGALGGSYGSPYIALDSSYYARPTGQATSTVSSRESSAAKPATTCKPPQISEIVNDEFGQRQNKPRRYSEMNFGQ